MRSFYFRPHIVLTILTLIGLAVLMNLGFWQKQRLAWKTELLASVEAAVNAPPFESLSEIQTALSNDDFTEFRRVDIPAELLPNRPPFASSAMYELAIGKRVHTRQVHHKAIAGSGLTLYRKPMIGLN